MSWTGWRSNTHNKSGGNVVPVYNWGGVNLYWPEYIHWFMHVYIHWFMHVYIYTCNTRVSTHSQRGIYYTCISTELCVCAYIQLDIYAQTKSGRLCDLLLCWFKWSFFLYIKFVHCYRKTKGVASFVVGSVWRCNAHKQRPASVSQT